MVSPEASAGEVHEATRPRRPSRSADAVRPIRVAVLAGYGFSTNDDATEGINPFGVGFGVRGGYMLGPVYLGTRFLFFLGQARGTRTGTERSADEWLLGLDGGYALAFGTLTLRPELGFGLANSSSEAMRNDAPLATSASSDPEPVDTSSNDLYVEAGLAFELSLSDELFVGMQARAVLVPSKRGAAGDHDLLAVPLLGSCGMRF